MTIAEFKKVNAATKTYYYILSPELKLNTAIIIDYESDDYEKHIDDIKRFEMFKYAVVQTVDVFKGMLLVTAILEVK